MKNKQTIDERIEYKDFIVVKDFETATALATLKNPPKSLRGKYIIVAPNGLEFMSEKDLIKSPAMKSLILDVVKEAVGPDYMDEQTALHNGIVPINHANEINLEKHYTLQRAKQILGMEVEE